MLLHQYNMESKARFSFVAQGVSTHRVTWKPTGFSRDVFFRGRNGPWGFANLPNEFSGVRLNPQASRIAANSQPTLAEFRCELPPKKQKNPPFEVHLTFFVAGFLSKKIHHQQ